MHRVQSRRNLPPRAANKSSRKKWLPLAIAGGMTLVGFVMTLALFGVLGIIVLTQDRIPNGVSVAGLPIGGKTLDDAESYLRQNIAGTTITAVDGVRTWTLSLADLGVSLDAEATLQAAEAAPVSASLPPRYTVDLNQAQHGLVALSLQANIPALPGEPGRVMDIPVTLDRLRVDVTGELADGLLELDMIEVEPPEPERGANFTGTPTRYTVGEGQELGLIAKEYGVSVEDIVALNGISNPDLLYVGQELLIPADGVYEPTEEDAPDAPASQGKSIVVSTDTQRIYAYENGNLVRSHLVSTGLSATPTVRGDYSVYVKYLADDMSGPGYFLPQVPYTMYFYQGYGIHGTYWHNSFGRPMSHGCVNLPTPEAEWFFNWAEVGTPVRVI